jgi:hypothetical protein
MFKHLKYRIIFIVVVLSSMQGTASDRDKPASGTVCQSFVIIHGSSNINQFHFTHDQPVVENTSGNFKSENYIRISVNGFDNTNKKMLGDFHEMVNAEEYPFIDIEIEPEKSADFDETSGLTKFKSKISIAGKTNEYIIPSEISACQVSGYMLKGNLMVKLTDFGIEPPRKVLGAVKVNDEVFINFAFRIPAEGVLSEDLP